MVFFTALLFYLETAPCDHASRTHAAAAERGSLAVTASPLSAPSVPEVGALLLAVSVPFRIPPYDSDTLSIELGW